MLWNTIQQAQISKASFAVERANAKLEESGYRQSDLVAHVERLSLACQAMWELLRDNSGLTEADIDAKILEINEHDQKVDGKMTSPPMLCPSCGQKTPVGRPNCMICGVPVQSSHKFEG